ncbi:uncharacterized protein LOC110038621 [Phalaenopsis equestris]|uniref:uncharacterized protein LOC110038621 n=1 Tax=Phalaenopsis equestris TaxID=78828 RepID=UPI0009E29187|nr:uncharacterized protein LOC110038621 [Phalaenopsis equestris]
MASRKPHSLYSHRSSILINHLTFADDVIIFSKASKPVVRLFMQCLENFQEVSGIKLNGQKCISVLSKQCKSEFKKWVSNFTGFTNSQLPVKYLGVFLIKGRTKNFQFDHILEKIQSKLQAWENSYLSNGGRITLLKSVLSAIPSYLLQMNVMKKATQRLLEGLGDSPIWKKMLHIREDAEQMFFWEIDDGLVNIWWDNWFLEGSLLQDQNAPTFPKYVKDLWEHDKWNLNPLNPILPILPFSGWPLFLCRDGITRYYLMPPWIYVFGCNSHYGFTVSLGFT